VNGRAVNTGTLIGASSAGACTFAVEEARSGSYGGWESAYSRAAGVELGPSRGRRVSGTEAKCLIVWVVVRGGLRSGWW
jgi:hypothetical protein